MYRQQFLGNVTTIEVLPFVRGFYVPVLFIHTKPRVSFGSKLFEFSVTWIVPGMRQAGCYALQGYQKKAYLKLHCLSPLIVFFKTKKKQHQQSDNFPKNSLEASVSILLELRAIVKNEMHVLYPFFTSVLILTFLLTKPHACALFYLVLHFKSLLDLRKYLIKWRCGCRI